jgi:hypothetical protein
MIGTVAAVCGCDKLSFMAVFCGIGQVAEWFKAAVLKTASREHLARPSMPQKSAKSLFPRESFVPQQARSASVRAEHLGTILGTGGFLGGACTYARPTSAD